MLDVKHDVVFVLPFVFLGAVFLLRDRFHLLNWFFDLRLFVLSLLKTAICFLVVLRGIEVEVQIFGGDLGVVFNFRDFVYGLLQPLKCFFALIVVLFVKALGGRLFFGSRHDQSALVAVILTTVIEDKLLVEVLC